MLLEPCEYNFAGNKKCKKQLNTKYYGLLCNMGGWIIKWMMRNIIPIFLCICYGAELDFDDTMDFNNFKTENSNNIYSINNDYVSNTKHNIYDEAAYNTKIASHTENNYDVTTNTKNNSDKRKKNVDENNDNYVISNSKKDINNTVFHPPPKIDIAIILDLTSSSVNGKHSHFNKSINSLIVFLDFVSVSPGSTRVALYTITDQMNQIFTFKTHVNRECVQKTLKEFNHKMFYKYFKYDSQPSINNFINTVDKIFERLREKSKTVDGQRHLFFFVTTSNIHVTTIRKNMQFEHFNVKDKILLLLPQSKKIRDRDQTIYQEIVVSKMENEKIAKNILSILELRDKSMVQCLSKNGSPAVDECERQCKCQGGRLSDCYRVRKEITSMTTSERRRYLRAYKTLTSVSPYKEIYEKFIFMHYKYFCWGIHNQELFLPWHRWFLSMMEDLLRQIDCRVTIPFWDWSYVSEDPWNRTNLWRSTDDGLGSNGNRYRGYCVEKGIFRESEWMTPYWEDPMDIVLSTTDQLRGKIEDQRAHLVFCLRRAFKGHTPSRNSVLRTLRLSPERFKDFDIQIRHNFHDRVHNIIGGTMCTHYAGDTPEFFLHHSFLDKIWYEWQQNSYKHKWVYFSKKNSTKMMGSEYSQYELVDSHDLPRCMKVKYQNFPMRNRARRDIDLIDEIDMMSKRSNLYWKKYLEQSWDGVFPNCSRSKKERKRAAFLHRTLDGPLRPFEIL